MNRLLIPSMLVLCLAPSVSSAVDIAHVRACYMPPFGATREDKSYLAGDVIFMTFDIEGLAIDPKSGKARYDTTLEFLDAKDKDKEKVLYKNTETNEARPQLGGTRMPGLVRFDTGVKRPPGRYSLRVTVRDKITKDGKTFTYTFDVLAPDTFGFFAVSASAIGFCGQFGGTSFALVNMGLDAKTKQPNTDVKIRILDTAGKDVVPPVQWVYPRDVPEGVVLEKSNLVPVEYPVYLNRAGRFTIEVTATDKIGKKTASFKFPMTVLDVNDFTK